MENNVNLRNVVKLVNNYFLEIIDSSENITSKVFDIENLKLSEILKSKYFMIRIDFNKFSPSEYKEILKKFLHIKNILYKKNFPIGESKDSSILLGYVVNYNEDDKKQIEFISAINAILFNKKSDRNNFIYDTVCDYLDSYFYGKNLCDFKDNRCENGKATSLVGCCRHFKHKCLGPISHLVLCEHLSEDKTCGAKCISCKLFTCEYLEKKGIKFRIKDILLLDTFFNPLQKYFIKTMVFTPKEKILKRLNALG